MSIRLAQLFLAACVAGVCYPQAAVAQDPSPVNGAATINREDRLQIAVSDLPGIAGQSFPVDPDGTVTLPLVGRIPAAGLTVDTFRAELANQLRVYIRTPQIVVKLIARVENKIAVGGGFKNPGIHSLPEQRSLLNVISAVGGLQADAGATIKIVRRLDMGVIPLPSVVEDPASNVSTATVNLKKLMENPDAMADFVIKPNDVLSADPPNTVYLTGEVLKPGAQDISDRESVGVTELVSMAGGFTRDADPRKARVLRRILNGAKRAEIPIDVTSILGGQAVDFAIQPNDIVEIPRMKGKANSGKSVLRYVVPAAASGLIYALIRR